MSDQSQIIRAKDKRGSLNPDSLAAPSEVKRSKGGQPGNRNAFKHGFYARNLGLVSPSKLPEKELRNLLGEAAMLKDYMYILYNCNIESHDSAVLAETLRGLALAGMALSRLLQVHNQVRVHASSNSSLPTFLAEVRQAGARANRIAASISGPDEEDDLDD